LLRFAFEKKEHIILKEFEKKLLLPKPEVILAMKINSLPNRDKEHKRIKDICDAFALAWYTDLNPGNVDLLQYLKKSSLKKCSQILTKEDYLKAGTQLGHDAQEIKRVFDILLV